MGTTYEEIKKKLKEYQAEGTTNKIKAVRTVNTLFDLCRKYCKYRPEEFSEVIDSLKDKIDNDKKFNCTNTAEELTVSGKMYIDFFYKAYIRYYGNEKEATRKFYNFLFVEGEYEPEVSKILNEVFKTEKVDSSKIEDIVYVVSDALYMWGENTESALNISKLHMDNLYRIMNILEKTFSSSDQELPDEKYSVEKILTPIFLDQLNGWLNDDAVGDVLTLFNVAPITRALYDGSPYSYTFSKKRDKSRSYIQNGIVHNYKAVKEYYNAIKELYDEYIEAKEIISDMWGNVK